MNNYPKRRRLLKRREYLAFKQQREVASGSLLLIEKRLVPNLPTRLGITVLKRFGSAHERNRFKRLVREAFRLSYKQLPQGLELLIKPRTRAKEALMQEIQQELLLLACSSTLWNNPKRA